MDHIRISGNWPSSLSLSETNLTSEWNQNQKYFIPFASRSLLCIRFVDVAFRSEKGFLKKGTPCPTLDLLVGRYDQSTLMHVRGHKAKKICVFTVTCWKKLGSVGRKYFFLIYFLWLNWCWVASRMHFYTSRVTFNLFLSKLVPHRHKKLHWKAKIGYLNNFLLKQPLKSLGSGHKLGTLADRKHTHIYIYFLA